MMTSKPGKTNGRNLVQTKLSFVSSASSKGNQQSATGKGQKRKLEESTKTAGEEEKMADARNKQPHHEENDWSPEAASGKQNDQVPESPHNLNSKQESTCEPSESLHADPNDEEAGSTAAGHAQQTEMGNDGHHDRFEDYDSRPDSEEDQDEDGDDGANPSKLTWDPNRSWRGKSLEEMKTTLKYKPQLPPLKSTDSHTVLIKIPFKYSEMEFPQPYPPPYDDRWDNSHVRMPCSPQNQYPREVGDKSPSLVSRWDMIKKALDPAKIRGSYELEEAILSYNQRYCNKWNFTALHNFINKELNADDRSTFFDGVLPEMIKLALSLPNVCTKPIPLLKKHDRHQLTLSQQQIACLLANAFFCTFPRRNSRAPKTEYSTYPDINFNNLFQGHPTPRKMQKLRCILHYFKRVLHKMPTGLLTFSRQGLPKGDGPRWYNEHSELTDIHVSSSGTIEDDGKGMLQVDFANKYLGGGVLGHGCVQEEIRFLICPELIVSRLFTEALEDNESLIMTGCEQYSMYKGYADSFQWDGDCQDTTLRDSWGRLCTEIVAIDALVFRNEKWKQFRPESVRRELNKAYCGFMTNAGKEAERPAVCTGNWGCGAFGGDKELKSLIQLMAASVAKREMCYFTFGDTRLVERLYKVYECLKNQDTTVGDTMRYIDRYNTDARHSDVSLFDFIYWNLEGEPLSDGSNTQNFDDDSNEAPGWSGKGGVSPDYKADTP